MHKKRFEVDKKIKILIAEDEVIVAQWMKIELEDVGYEVLDYVTTGEKAIESALENKPDIILLDVNLSGEIDGIDAAEKITDTLNTPIIFMTGYNESSIFERAQKINPAAYLEKPVEIYDIKPIIDAIYN